MIKKMVYYGLAMLVLAAVLFFGSGYLFSSGLGKSITLNNFTIGADNFSSYPITYTNASEVAVYVIATKPINTYLMNSSDYLSWSSHMLSTRNSSGLSYAEQLGISTNDIFKNASLTVIPLLVNSSANVSKNKFYVILDNTFGSHSFNSSVNATVSYFPLHTSKLIVYELLDVLAFVILVAGIIILIWGLVKTNEPKVAPVSTTGKPTKSQKDKEYVDQLYKGVKKSKKKNQSNEDNDSKGS